MRILICDTDSSILERMAVTTANADYITATNAGEALQAGPVNMVVISEAVPEWEAVARNYTSSGTAVYIIADDITNINTWKKSTDMGCKGVWGRDTASVEIEAKLKSSVNSQRGEIASKRPLRGQLNRSAPKLVENLHQLEAQIPQRQQPVAFKQQQPGAVSIIPRREIITFYGANGGVAKTTMAINTGVALARCGQSTVLVDFDVYNGDVVHRLNIKPLTTMIDWIKGHNDDISQCLVEHSSGLKILPSPLNHEEGELITAEVAIKILSILARRFDMVIVDASHLLIAPIMVSLENATRAYILCTPDSACVAKTNKMLKRLDMLSFEKYKLKLLVTRMPLKRQPLRVNDIAEKLGLELGGVIPYDESLQIDVNQGTPPVLSRRAKNFSRAVNSFCAGIVPNSQNNGGGLLSRFFKR